MKSQFHQQQLRIAIVEPNVLACMGLQSLLTDLFPMVETVVCESFQELQQHTESVYVHYFVSSRIYFEHTAYFRSCSGRSIVLVNGDMSINGVATLNVCQGQAALVRALFHLQQNGHYGRPHAGAPDISASLTHNADTAEPVRKREENVLSPREVEVALLLCHGYINKEVADKLNISLTTVITHRRNIMDKLNARSLADVIVYCVMNGIYTL